VVSSLQISDKCLLCILHDLQSRLSFHMNKLNSPFVYSVIRTCAPLRFDHFRCYIRISFLILPNCFISFVITA
jgi:hypothetical protein